jgi:hypothetical protein
MPRLGEWRMIELLVTVKAYPSISTTYGEAVCVAGVRLDIPSPEWVRLFPVKFRDLPLDRRFAKYQVIRVRACKHSTDRRVETWRPDLDSIEPREVIEAKRYWSERRAVLDPLIGPSMCDLIRARRASDTGVSLGLVRPREVLGLRVAPSGSWSPGQLGTVGQGNLLTSKTDLVKPGHAFAYRYLCEDAGCSSHTQTIVDWEIGEAYRSWAQTGDALLDAIRNHWLDDLCGPGRDPMFFVGDQLARPGQFLVLGTWWPARRPDDRQLALSIAA